MSLKYNDVTIRSDFPGEIDTPTYVSDLDATTFPKAKHYQELLDLEKYEEAESYLNSAENEDLRRCMASAKLLNEMQDRICAAQITINSRDAKQERIMQKEKPAYIDQTTDRYWIKEIGEDAQGDKYGNEYVRYGENLGNSEYAQLKIEPGTRKDDTNIGIGSFVTGNNCEASGVCSFAGGYNTIAKGENQTVVGKYNEKDTNDKYAFIVGGGTSDNDRKNLMSVDWNGNVKYKGSIIANNDVELENGISLSALDNHIKLFEQTLIDKIYPIGSIYMSVNNVSPSVFLGGTWVQIKDTFLLSAGDTYLAGSTGGEPKHELSLRELPTHRHEINVSTRPTDTSHMHSIKSQTITTNSSGAHAHKVIREDTSTNKGMLDDYASTTDTGEILVNSVSGGLHTHKFTIPDTDTTSAESYHNHAVDGFTNYSGGSSAHNNMPPYLTVYMWKRII